MDFLILFILYSGLLLLTVLVCICSGKKQSLSSKLATWVTQILSRVIPTWVQRAAQKAVRRIFHTRNNFFVVLHLTLEMLVCGEYTLEVFGYCHKLEFNSFFLLLPYLLLVVNVSFFIVCSRTNPGAITKTNQPSFLHTYVYDGVMFQQGVECLTCRVKKPARSKHCRLCNSCVHRFDHHCIWVNNCIGAFNSRYFLGYLGSLISLAVSIAILTAGFLIQVVLLSNLMVGHYTDDQGQEHPVDTFFLIQYLFLAFPRIVFMLGFAIILSVILGSYFCFILHLVLINQTSNEWFKSGKYTSSSTQKGYKNIYSRGIWANITEILKP